MWRPAHRALSVPPFHAMAMSALASQREAAGERVLHLEVGQPASGAPAAALDAVRSGLDRPLGYTDAPGLPALRERIAAHYAQSYGVEVDPGRVMVVAGASAGFTLGFLACFEPGDRVGVLEPGYPCYRNGLLALGMEPVPITVGPDCGWTPTAAMLSDAGPLAGLVVASPSNPTGTALSPERLDEVARHCTAHEIRLVADEIYHGITYGAPAPTAVGVDGAVVINSFSKYYSMTGWRVGWMVLAEDLIDPVVRLQQNLYICAPHISQVAALGAMDATDELDGHVERYAVNRRLLLEGLAAAGIDRVAAADGAFYVYADIEHLTDSAMDSMRLCRRWLDDLGVACTPGIDFDLDRGDRFVRFSYAGETATITEACDLIGTWR
jgi:aspartate/methionine/tyrosine aminotransferase